jgi:GntR family transcriptional regulator
VIPITLNSRDPRPIYLQVKESLRQLIIGGVLTPESKLPSVREIAGTLAINPNTIQRAYRELEAEGFIYSIPGKGSFVSPSREISGEELRRRWEDLDRAVRELRFLGVSEEELIRHLKDKGGDAK